MNMVNILKANMDGSAQDLEKRRLVKELSADQSGMATVEYAIVLVAAAGLAGVLVAILKSDWVKEMLQSIISNALGGVV